MQRDSKTAKSDEVGCECRPTSGYEPSHAERDVDWKEGSVRTIAGEIPRVAATLRFKDRLDSWKIRWGIGRMRFSVNPGLYAVGNPTSVSNVFVTANYKMSFDRLRSQLGGRDAWILVLDTKGINVWCAAGKGTFGTEEIIHRMKATRLSEIVSQRKLVLPQLGAPGVRGHEVTKRTRFKVIYGPVRAEDLPAFLDAGMKATTAMRHVRFQFRDRVILIPVEVVASAKYAILIAASLFLLSGLGTGLYSPARAMDIGLRSVVLFFGAFLAGAVLTPALLPWLPGRSFAAKGAWAGLLVMLAATSFEWIHPGLFENWLNAIAWFLIIPAVASFIGMNFTGASTYTSLSGVKREMRVAIPIQVVCAVVGLGSWLAARWA